jgi:hypothetical protein
MIEFVSIKSAVLDWVDDNGLGHEEVNHPLLIKWAGDCVQWCSSQEQLKPRIGVFQIENSRLKLPADFKMLCQAASNVPYDEPCDCKADPENDCCSEKKGAVSMPPKTRREDLVQWVQGTMEKDCNLEINLNCPRCHTSSCSCDTPLVEVDVDRIWEMAHPEIYYGHYTRIGRFGNGPGQNSPYASIYTPKFRLMRYASNDFHRLRQVIGDCPNVNCDNCHKEFIISDGYLEVDFDKGEVLLSYLGKVLDEDGELMIPDHPDVHEAIINHLDYKWYRLQWKKEKDSAARAISQEAMQLREQHIGYAKDALDMPSYLKFKEYLEGSAFMKRMPKWQSDYAGKHVPDDSMIYGKMLRDGE